MLLPTQAHVHRPQHISRLARSWKLTISSVRLLFSAIWGCYLQRKGYFYEVTQRRQVFLWGLEFFHLFSGTSQFAELFYLIFFNCARVWVRACMHACVYLFVCVKVLSESSKGAGFLGVRQSLATWHACWRQYLLWIVELFPHDILCTNKFFTHDTSFSHEASRRSPWTQVHQKSLLVPVINPNPWRCLRLGDSDWKVMLSLHGGTQKIACGWDTLSKRQITAGEFNVQMVTLSSSGSWASSGVFLSLLKNAWGEGDEGTVCFCF